MTGRVVIDNAALAQLLKGRQGPVFRYTSEIATRVQRRAKIYVRKRTHRLEQSIVKRIYPDSRNGFEIQVGSSEGHAMVEEKGSRPHIIKARNAKVLVFSVNGQTVFTPLVHHPGTKGSHYLTRAARDEGLRIR